MVVLIVVVVVGRRRRRDTSPSSSVRAFGGRDLNTHERKEKSSKAMFVNSIDVADVEAGYDGDESVPSWNEPDSWMTMELLCRKASAGSKVLETKYPRSGREGTGS